jgi:hypothetical protein
MKVKRMRTVEIILVLAMIAIIVVPQVQPGVGEWSGSAHFFDFTLGFALRVDACSKFRFQGDISRSQNSILSFTFGRDGCAEGE